MSAEASFLCDNCPGKGDAGVDPEVRGSCMVATLDSFCQARRYKLCHSDDYSSDEELAEMTAASLDYYDPEIDDYYSKTGDARAAWLGVACAQTFLRGACTKELQQILNESEID